MGYIRKTIFVECDDCRSEISEFESCYYSEGEVLCSFCAAERDFENYEKITGEDALYRIQSTFMNLDDARER